MATKKSIRIGKENKYELFLVFERFQGFTVKKIYEKLPPGYCSLKTLYNYHARYKRAEKKLREATRGW